MATAQTESAFPTTTENAGGEGMTLRDYFAAKAMQSYLTSPNEDETVEDIAEYAYVMADAMLEERDK